MSNLKVGDLVMVGGAASADLKARNAGKFRTVVGFKPKGYEFYEAGVSWYCAADSAVLDGPFSVFVQPLQTVATCSIIKISSLVKINPGDAEDETLTWVGKPNKQTEPDKEAV